MNSIKEKLKNNKTIFKMYNFSLIQVSNMHYIINKSSKINVYSIEETLDKLHKSKSSMVRFGDGEMELIQGKGIKFQKYDKDLADKLKIVLQSNFDDLIVCIPDIFNSLSKYDTNTSDFWKKNLLSSRKHWNRLLKNQNYYNAFVTRLYFIAKSYVGNEKFDIKKMFRKFKMLYNNKHCVLIEGKFSRLGVGNDLFDNVKSLKRILCPTKNAFEKYDEILETVKKQPKDKLILISLGPTAKVLAYDLYLLGYHVLDIGHIDVEYEWYKIGTDKKVSIKNKYVNEVESNDLNDIDDKKYLNQIISEI